MRTFIGITDYDWYDFLASMQGLDEVNFWQPSASTTFQAISPGEPFLFKLHSPNHFIVGGGFFAHYTRLPVSLAWSAFEEKNGARSLAEMRRRIEKYRRTQPDKGADYEIGCILLEQPFFFRRNDWIPAPADWSANIVRGKGYDTATGEGKRTWDAISLKLSLSAISPIEDGRARYGEPTVITPRLGQGSFRVIVTDAYGRRCAVTNEKTLPALEASHIKPYTESGPHDVRNGILFRSDIHRLFDKGYVTVSEDYRFEVSARIKEEFENGRDYCALHGNHILLPRDENYWPHKQYIRWHQENVFR
ncbi:MAG TPA: HNH endonuclease [Syntrophales bacterium]|nr:HNH endonuclease [Syntrophales bacterium]